MKRGFVILLFLVAIFAIIGMLSSFETGDKKFELTKKYSQNSAIKGWINISLEDEETNSIVKDNLGNSVSLINLLKNNSGLNYTCSPGDCESNYESGNPQSIKTISLNKGESKIIGLKFTGNNFQSISDFSINISSNAPENTGSWSSAGSSRPACRRRLRSCPH